MTDISTVILSYLETLSHEELIGLIRSFAMTHEDVLLHLEEKSTAVIAKREVSATVAQKQQMPQTLPTMDAQNTLELSSSESAAADAFTPSHPLVNRNSMAQEKINLYTSLFIGRQDVFALRWYNAKSNKSGYSPVCQNKWQRGKCDMKKYSCAACPFKLPVPLSDRYIFNHLAGKDTTCRDVIGLYPLIEGDVCRFLAFL